MDNNKSRIIELNIGGLSYATTIGTLTRDPSTLFYQYFNSTSLSNTLHNSYIGGGSQSNSTTPNTTPAASPMQQLPGTDISLIIYQPDGKYFIDRDGPLFRYILDYLRTGKLMVPDNFQEINRLKEEAKFYKVNELMKILKNNPSTRRGTLHGGGAGVLPSLVNGSSAYHSGSTGTPPNISSGHITVGYRGTFAFGRDGQADVKFRKLSRIIVCGRANLCREVFGETLNESRDPDRCGENRYTARLYLKHSSLELAFDMLAERGFELLTSCASGTCAGGDMMRGSAADSEEQKWNHYNEFIFYRSP